MKKFCISLLCVLYVSGSALGQSALIKAGETLILGKVGASTLEKVWASTLGKVGGPLTIGQGVSTPTLGQGMESTLGKDINRKKWESRNDIKFSSINRNYDFIGFKTGTTLTKKYLGFQNLSTHLLSPSPRDELIHSTFKFSGRGFVPEVHNPVQSICTSEINRSVVESQNKRFIEDEIRVKVYKYTHKKKVSKKDSNDVIDDIQQQIENDLKENMDNINKDDVIKALNETIIGNIFILKYKENEHEKIA